MVAGVFPSPAGTWLQISRVGSESSLLVDGYRIVYKVPLRDMGIVKSRGRLQAKRESQVTPVYVAVLGGNGGHGLAYCSKERVVW